MSESDREVLEAVFLDLLSYSGEDSPVAVHGKAPVSIQVAGDSAKGLVTAKDVLYQHEPEPWAVLSESQVSATREAAAELVRRTKEKRGFSGFRSPDPRVQAPQGDVEPGDPRSLFRKRPIVAWPPGYSANESLVIVRLRMPWSIHLAVGTYVMVNRQGRWVVLVRQFVYYP